VVLRWRWVEQRGRHQQATKALRRQRTGEQREADQRALRELRQKTGERKVSLLAMRAKQERCRQMKHRSRQYHQ
jgi:hypothetical protein